MQYIKGNLLDADTEALVNTVNTVGVMGKGIALQFKERFPHNNRVYVDACKRGDVQTGKLLVVKENTMKGDKLIINFPTKTEWFRKSQYKFIEEGLAELVEVIREHNIKSIAIPPLGCGNGGLKWEKVKKLMTEYLGSLSNVDVKIYEPNDAIKEVLQKENNKKQVELKPGRAMLLYSLYKYEKFGEYASVFVANKLAYFLQRSGEPLRLNFIPHTYGPYDQAVEKVLYSLNGLYLFGLEQMTAKAFEPLALNYAKYDEVDSFIKRNLASDQLARLENVFKLIDGFETPLSLEILSSVHFLLSKEQNLNEEELLNKIQAWNERKKNLITKQQINIAVEHLNVYRNTLNFV